LLPVKQITGNLLLKKKKKTSISGIGQIERLIWLCLIKFSPFCFFLFKTKILTNNPKHNAQKTLETTIIFMTYHNAFSNKNKIKRII
jgi:hypothetical protein